MKAPRGRLEGAAAPSPPARGWLWAALALALLLAVALAWRQTPDRDVGFHLAAGRYILEHRAWPITDPFTYTIPEAPYVDMNGLFQVLLALAFRIGGDIGTGVLVVAFTCATALVLWRHARGRCVTSPMILVVGFTLGLLAWEMRFLPRPELASCLFLAILLALLRRHADSGRAVWLWPVPALQLVWVYSHSLSSVGLGVAGLYALLCLTTPRRRDWAPSIAFAGSALAVLLNPYGWRGLEFLWSLRTRLSAGNVFAAQIDELKSPFSAEVHNIWPVLMFKLALGLGALLVLLRVRRRTPFDLLIFAGFAVLAASAVRNVGLFIVAGLPIALECAQELADAVTRRQASGRRATAPVRTARVAAGAGVAFVMTQVILGGYYVADLRPERFGVGLSPAIAPEGCVAFMDREGVAGPIFNELRFGGFLLGRLWPREKVFIDGRLEVIGESFYQQYVDVLAGPGWEAMVRRYDPNAALIATTSRAVVTRLAESREWASVAVDGASVLFLRRRPENADRIAAGAARFAALNRAGGPDDQPLAPRPDPSWWRRLFTARRYPWEARGRGNAFMLLGLDEAARREYRRALVEAGRDEPTLAFNFASANYRLGRRDEARVWYQRALDFDPTNRLAQERLAALAGGRAQPE